MYLGDRVVFERDELRLIVELAGGCSLDESPGSNWVQRSGGLPRYICEIARAIKRSGKSTSQAIAIAVSRVKKWAAGADDVDADTRAKAAKALAEWEKLKGKNKAKSAAKDVKASHTGDILCLSAKSFNVDKVRQAFEASNRAARDEWYKNNPGSSYSAGVPPYMYVREMWSDYLIASAESRRADKLFKVGYTVDAKNNVTFSEPVEVQTQYVAVTADDLDDDIDDSALQKLLAMTGSDLDDVVRLSAGRDRAADLNDILRLGR